MYHNLKKGAIFVADSHFNKKNQEFLVFLKKLEICEIKTNQLILLGDNFDFLSSESKYFIKINQEAIELLNKLSQNIEILYLEGNHDFNLKEIFPNIKIISRENQPYIMQNENKTIAISHGDNFVNKKYDFFCKIIRNHYLLLFLNFIDYKFCLSKKIEKALLQKNICHKIDGFEKIVQKRLKNYENNIIIEGHYHQGEHYCINEKAYINIHSLCCSKKYIIFSNLDNFIIKRL